MQIRTLSVREYATYMFVNIVFSFDKEERHPKYLADEYIPVRAMDSEEDYINYIDGLQIIEKARVGELIEMDISSSYHKEPETKYINNHERILQYNEKFNVYSYSQFIEINQLTKAAISMLKEFKEKGTIESTRDDIGYVLSLIQCLDKFWD